MGTKKGVAKKRGGKKAGNPERDQLEKQLNKTGGFVLSEYCEAHGIEDELDENESIETLPKERLISFLLGKFDDGEITINDLYPDQDATPADDDDELGLDDDDASGGDDDIDDEIEEVDDDDDLGGGVDDDDDDDEIDVDSDDLDELAGDDDDDDRSGPAVDIDFSALEGKLDKLLDISAKIAHRLDLLVQLSIEGGEIARRSFVVLFKLCKAKDPQGVMKKIAKKARNKAGIDGDDESEDE